MESLKIFSLNAIGIRNSRKRKYLFRLFREKKYDLICIQESYITNEVSDAWKREWGGDLVFCEGTNHAKGQLILIRKHFPYSWTSNVVNDRIVTLSFNNSETDFTVFNVYAPNNNKDMKLFIQSLTKTVKECNATQKIICGDFNAVMSNKMDIISGEKHPDVLINMFNNFVHECNLHDVWRIYHNDVKEYTWSRKNQDKLIARRLDYVLVNDSALDEIIETYHYTITSSDHRGVFMQMKLSNAKRGPGYWKFNNSLLTDKTFVDMMNEAIDNYVNDNTEENVVLKWELLKLKIKQESIMFSKAKAVKKRNDRIDLHNKLNACDEMLSIDPQNIDLLKQREKLKLQTELYEQEQSKSAQIRSRIKWIEEGEKNTKYFLNLEKSRANSKIFPSIKLDNGNIIRNQMDILKEQKSYFEKVYSRSFPENMLEQNIDTFLEDCDTPELSEVEANSCEGLLTVEEASEALQAMKNNSSPGLDGLTFEFLKMFWIKLRNTVVQSFNASFNNGSLSYSQTSAVLTLIHKGKDLPKDKLSNWRPISLTNSDYKILAKCLANRLCNVIKKLVHEHQVGYIKGRNVATTLRTIDDVLEFYRLKEKPGVLLALDFQKAFDSISKPYMLCAFKKFGFGKDFLKWVEVLFSNTRSCIAYNGWISSDFQVNCGIRQGCPFSPLAFVIGIELLAIKFRQSSAIKGLDICPEKVLKVLLYADDITMFLKDEKDVETALKILEDFTVISGLHLNKNKSEAMWIGERRNSNDSPFELKWVNQIKILGIHFSSTNTASHIELNWKPKIIKIKQKILSFQKRNLGLLGKICIIKSLLASELIYTMQAICIPDKVLVELNTILYRFLWRKKDCNKKAFEKVKRVVVNSSVEKGGINMIDIKIMQQSFLCQWMYKMSLSSSFNDTWTWIPKSILSIFGRDLACFNTSVKLKHFKGLDLVESSFWKSVISTWLSNNRKTEVDFPKMTCLWNNPEITYQNKVVFFKTWANCGFTYVNDMLQDNVIMSFPTVQAILGPSPNLYLEYIVVSNALTSFLKKYPNYVHSEVLEQVKLPFSGVVPATAKVIRKSIVEAKYNIPHSTAFWQNKFNIQISQFHWNIAKQATKESRLRELHWKVLHNIYPTQILLKKMGLADNDFCPYCPNEKDYIEHFFFECKQIKPIWKFIEQKMLDAFNYKITLTKENILTGIIAMTNTSVDLLKHLNHLILIGKMCISKYRYGTPIDIIIMFENEVRLRLTN